jgi:hypothetical protein
MKEFCIKSDVVSRRFKSLFGKTIREVLYEKFYPTREELEDALITSNNVREMQEKLNMSSTSAMWKGLLDREFGYSRFANAKSNYILKQKVAGYNPTKSDNVSILISQLLGDGYYGRGYSLRIEHGEKQFDYLKFKVGLINKAFPETPGISSISKRVSNSGYVSYVWRSNKTISPGYLNKLDKPIDELISMMTPVGWLLWYLDDGCYYKSTTERDTSQSIISISSIDQEIRTAAIKELKTYGYRFIDYPKDIRLSDKVQVASFLTGMIKPFNSIIPTCMKYKYDMKI